MANSIRDFSENHEDIDDVSDEAIMYAVKYIGATEVTTESGGQQKSDEVVKKIISNQKSAGTKKRVLLSISPKGIEVTDATSGENLLQVSIYRISHCAADASHSHVFSFIESAPPSGGATATDSDDAAAKNAFSGSEESEGVLTCHAFLCQKRKMAHTVTLTVARSFERAYQIWQNRQFQTERKRLELKNESNKKPTAVKEDAHQSEKSLIDLNTDLNTELAPCHRDTRDYLQTTWVSSIFAFRCVLF